MANFELATLALVRDGRILLARKRGEGILILPGGKVEAGETHEQALRREVAEELGCAIPLGKPTYLGRFDDVAGGEPGNTVTVHLYQAGIEGHPSPCQEIEELSWEPLARPSGRALAPSLSNQVIPFLRAREAASTRMRHAAEEASAADGTHARG